MLCRSCALSYPALPSICYVCARATAKHTACKDHVTKHGPQQVYIVGEYTDVLKALIHAYKFDYRRAAAKDIAFILDTAVPYINDVTISYVPATGAHVRVRGFNHIRNISKNFANLRKPTMQKRLSEPLPLLKKVLIKLPAKSG